MNNGLKGTIVNPDVIRGKSAYEIAVEHYGIEKTGTEQEWIEKTQRCAAESAASAKSAKESEEKAKESAEIAKGKPAGIKGYRIKGFSHVHYAAGGDPNKAHDFYFISVTDAADLPAYPTYISKDYGSVSTPYPREAGGIRVDWAKGQRLTLMNANNWDEACTVVGEFGDEENGYWYKVSGFPFEDLWVQHANADGGISVAHILATSVDDFNALLAAIENKVDLGNLSYCVFNLDLPDSGVVDGGENTYVQGGDCNAYLEGAASFGDGNESLGKYSFTTGRNNKAYYASNAEGRGNVAGADISHAEGQNNVINRSARNSHVEGVGNEMNGYGSHGEGANNVSYASMAHVEGCNNEAGEAELVGKDMNTNCVHIEGSDNKALGKESNIHIEGRRNSSNGSTSHTEGTDNKNVDAHFAHIEGGSNTVEYDPASNNYGHAEGYGNTLKSNCSHIEGSRNKCIGSHATHVEGQSNQDYGSASTHIEGGENVNGEENIGGAGNAHIEGYQNKIRKNETDGKYEGGMHVEGRRNTVRANSAHVEGSDNENGSTAHWSHLGGRYSKTLYEGSDVHGLGLRDSCAYQVVRGKYNKDNPNALFILGNGTSYSVRSNAFEVISTSSGVSIKIGNTTLTEAQLKSLL